MPSMSCTYLVPAILLNPAFILHLINTFVSRLVPDPLAPSHSPNPFMESLGPRPGSTPYLDMHTDDQLCCYGYTAIMVVVQILAFGRVQDNRTQRKGAKAASKFEKERLRKEKLRMLQADGNKAFNGMNAATGANDGVVNGNGKYDIARACKFSNDGVEGIVRLESEQSMTETSEEEMML